MHFIKTFYKKSKLSLDQQSDVIKFVLVVCQSRGLLQYIKTKVLTTCCYLKALLKAKGDLELVSCFIFCMIFGEKYFSRYILLIDQISLPDCLYFLRYRTIYVLKLFLVQSVA